MNKIIVGMPFNADGQETQKTRQVSEFIEFLKNNLNIEIIGFDERFTTKDAENVLIQANISRKKRKEKIDSLAAALILQGYLKT